MGLMAAGNAPHYEILVESRTSRHRFQSGLLPSGDLDCDVYAMTLGTAAQQCECYTEPLL